MSEIETNPPQVDWTKLMAAMEQPELYYRRPGWFRRWEVTQVVQEDGDFRGMEDSATSDGTRLYAIYRREPVDHAQARAIHALVHAGRLARSATPSVGELATEAGPASDGLAPMPQQMFLFGQHLAPPRTSRMPGLFTRRELDEVLAPSSEHHVEAAGALRDGTELFQVFLHVRDLRPTADCASEI
jgi:hypothetical protein